MYLELAEGEETRNPYLFVPDFEAGTGGIFIREDKFDSMPTDQYKKLLNLLGPFQPKTPGGLNEDDYLSSRADRKARRDEKKDQKATNKANREQRKEDNNERKNQRQTARDERKANRKPFDFKGAIDTVGGVVSKFTGKGGEEFTPEAGGSSTPGESKPFYKNPAVLIGGAVVIGGIAYLLTRKK